MKAIAARAAVYVRMSTESQDYSTDHQRAKIREYAESKGLTLVREYIDGGKSGLDLKRRSGLRALIEDVQSHSVDFSYIIVYDISRWGRFQDIDEAAYYEHMCRRAGVQVIYCAEKFNNDGSPYSALLKGMKRIMAAEYSRELSEKVFLAQCRFIEKGFKQGGLAGYGLRRLAITANGVPRAVLEHREAKGCATDRVILVLGPEHEIATVKRMYRLYIESRMSDAGIARLLNSEEVPSEFGRPWSQAMVKSILTNCKYYGTLAYNRRSCKLSTPRKRNVPESWVVNPHAIDPVISRQLFDEAQHERQRRQRRYHPNELLALLRDCYQTYGKVTAAIIAADERLPDPQLFVRAFGSLIRAYDAAGLPRLHAHTQVETKKRAHQKRLELTELVEALALKAGATVGTTAHPFTLLLNDTVTVRIEVLTCRRPRRGLHSWKVSNRKHSDFCIAARIEPGTYAVLDFYRFTAADLASGPLYLKSSNLHQYTALRFPSIPAMFS